MKEKGLLTLLFGSVVCTALLLVRMLFSGANYYDFMLWNLFLAWIPVVISTGMIMISKTKQDKWLYPLFFVWLMFIPNAPYVVTDFIHLIPRNSVPILFDAVLLLTFSIVGISLGLFSFLDIEHLIRSRLGKQYVRPLHGILLLIISVGVMMGRIFRWNSWDVFFSPQRIVYQLNVLFHSYALAFRLFTWTFAFFIFLLIIHSLLKKIIRIR